MLQHPLTGIDPAVVHMAVKAPERAPVELKAMIANAAILTKSRKGKQRLPLDHLLGLIQQLAKQNGYIIMYSTGNTSCEETYSFQKMKTIMEEVAEKHDVSVHEIKSACRIRDIIPARHEFFYRARTETLRSYPEIGRFCGGRDHTTVLHGVRKYAELHGKPIPGAIK